MFVFPRSSRGRFGILVAFSAFLGMLCCDATAATGSITLPPMFDRDDFLRLHDARTNRSSVELGGIIAGSNNVGSLWEISEDGQPPRTFRDDSGYAVLQDARWVSASHGEWLIGYGRGHRDSYVGNSDAAQLWIDLHAAGATKQAYAPAASHKRISAAWYGVGRTVRFRPGNMTGTVTVWLRQITADDYLARSVVGQAVAFPEESFSGTMRIASGSKVEGRGWSLDARTVVRFGEHWEGVLTAEGLMGNMCWKGIDVEDGYFTSPGVFTDRDGFLRDYGGITGAAWQEDASLSLNTRYRIELIRRGKPDIMAAYDYEAGRRGIPSLGMASSRPGKWSSYVRYYPTESRLELGAIGPNWRFRISGDDWPTDSPKHAEAAFSASVIRF